MKYNFIKQSLLVIVLIKAFTITCLSQDCLNLYKLTLNDSVLLRELTVERLTDILGRPSATQNNALISDILGPRVFYHDKGLNFWFQAKSKDPQQRLMSIGVYMVRTWDKDFNEFYFPFSGKVVPNLNPNMKIDDILPLFENYPVTILTAEQRREKMKEALKGINIKLDTTEDVISVENNGNEVNLFCEEVTKYFGRFTINFNVNE